MRGQLNHYRLLTFVVLCSLLLSASCSVGVSPSDSLLNAMNRAIDELHQQPSLWEGTMMTLLKEIGNQRKELVTEIQGLLEGAQSVVQSTIHTAGAEVRCNMDRIGQVLADNLGLIRDRILLKKTSAAAPIPWLCGWVPDHVNLISQAGQWRSDDPLVRLYGFNFTYAGLQKIVVEMRTPDGKVSTPKPVTPIFQTAYEVHLNLQAATFPGAAAGAKLTVTWPNMTTPYETALLIKSGPPVATVVPAPPAVYAPPSLVMGLRHNQAQKDEFYAAANMGALPAPPVYKLFGGDLGCSSGCGFTWWTTPDDPNAKPEDYKLPAGVVLGLKHNTNQKDVKITVFGRDPCDKNSDLIIAGRFRRYEGGDLGGGSGQGYCWYESLGVGFNTSTDAAWAQALPRYTVVGLAHTDNQPGKNFTWDKVYAPAGAPNLRVPPSGYAWQGCFDSGASSGHGYCWFEKATGLSLIMKSP